MRRKFPTINALTAFEVAARHKSFSRAAIELSLTESAVCRQVASLESFVGVKLFRRSGRGVDLTEAGATYSSDVRHRLDELERDTLSVMANAGVGGSVELAVMPTFATRWLLPRLPRFQRLHPGITLHLESRTRPFLFEEASLDAAIHTGHGAWPGTHATLLMREHLIVVGSPDLVPPGTALEPRDLVRYVLLQPSTRPYVWRQWFGSQGLQVEGDLHGPRMELFSMLSQAAVCGMGLALLPPFLIESELQSGQLVQITKHAIPSDLAYYLIVPERQRIEPAVSGFCEWLKGEAADYCAESAGEMASVN